MEAWGTEQTENIPMPENKSEKPAANAETTQVTEAGAENLGYQVKQMQAME